VLYAVRRRGEARVDDVAAALGITITGARAHLTALSEQGLVAARQEPATGRGRPRLLYRATVDADRLFPKAYGELTNELLGFLDDPAVEERLFDLRRDQRVENATSRMTGANLEQRVAILADILDADGYMATWEARDDGSFVVAEHNCAIAAVAAQHPTACRSEIDFIRAVLPDTTVERTSHIVSGDVRCAYVISPI
jgi:predicted ArsR family transcriptional regulator